MPDTPAPSSSSMSSSSASLTSSLDVLSLSDRLASNGPITLNDDERRAIIAALAELARSAIIGAKQEALLRSYGEDGREIERLALRGVALAAGHGEARAAEQRAAGDAVAAARARLAAEARASGDLRGIIAAAVRFAIAVVAPA